MNPPLFVIDGLYENRVCIFVEIDPQSNKYHQLLLTKTQFQAISKAIFAQMENCTKPDHDHEKGCVSMWFSDDPEITLPDKIKSHYTQAEMDKMD